MRPLFSILSALALLLAPATAAAQACGIVPGASAGGGYASYRVGGGTSGIAVGGDVAVEISSLGLQVGYRHVLIEGEAADPDVVRAVAAYPVVSVSGMNVCAVAHGGLARFSFEGDTGDVMAGGIGVAVAPSIPGPIQPYASVRGLGARAAGTVLGLDVDASGLSFGGEAGVTLLLGPTSFRVTGTVDGFDDGLGITPYPGYSIELAFQIRF